MQTKQLAALAAAGFLLLTPFSFAQINSPRLVYVTVNPAGACSTGPLQFNVLTGALYGCVAGTWTAVGGGGGGSITEITGSGGITITNPTGPTVNVDGSAITGFGFTPTKTSSTVIDVTGGTMKPGAGSIATAAVSYTLTQYNMSACTAAASMACTITSAPAGTTLQNGMTVSFTGLTCSGTCVGINAPFLVTDYSGGVVTVAYNSSSAGTINVGSAKIGANGSASGTAYGCLDPVGNQVLVMPANAGLLVVGTGPYINRQANSPSCEYADAGLYGLRNNFTMTISTTGNGTWDTLTYVPSAFTMFSFTPGTGIDFPCTAGLCVPAVTGDVTRNSANNDFTGAQDMTNATSFRPPGSNTPPATCPQGAIYIDRNATASEQLLVCSDGSNTWTKQGGGGTILGAISANAGTVPFGTGTANTVTDDTSNFLYNSTSKILTVGNVGATQYLRMGALVNGGILGSGAYGCVWSGATPTNANWNACFGSGASNFYNAPNSGGAHFFYINGTAYTTFNTTKFQMAQSYLVEFANRSYLSSPADGNLLLQNNARTDFGLLQLGGTTLNFPAWKRSNTTIQARLADDSGYAGVTALYTLTPATTVAGLPSSPVEGMRAGVTDSNAASCTAGVGTAVVGGGSTHCPVYYDGTNWIIF